MYTIYCHVFPNKKRYVGLTKTSLNKRWDNGRSYKTCPLVNRAIEKYGWENVKHEILAEVDTREEAEILERIFILQLNSNDPKHGYNILPGGDVATNELTDEMRKKLGNGWRGKHRTESEKAAIGEGVKKAFQRNESNGHFGMHHTDETRKRMSETHKKQWNNEDMKMQASERMKKRFQDPEYKKRIVDNLHAHRPVPKPLSEETKAKLSTAFKGRWIGEKSPCSKPVIQFTKDGVLVKRWVNAREAERDGVALASNIQKVCNKRPHCLTAGGYKWEYEISFSEQILQKRE